MEEIKLAILRDVMLANNGYVTMACTMQNVRHSVKGSTLLAIKECFNDLVRFGHIVLLGKDRAGQEYYCLPEKRHTILQMMEDLTR